jgi:D-glutamate cyclase
MNETKLAKIAETLDQLIKLDIPARGIIGTLYDAARVKAGEPLTLAAVKLLQKAIKPGDKVIIATGWVDQPVIEPGCGETDGPPGALALARALRLTLKAAPVIVTDACLVEGVRQVARAAGFQCVQPENLIHSIERNKLLTISVLPFPVEWDQARQQAVKLLDELKPTACIAIERGGVNADGIIHNMLGHDTGDSQAKVDYIFQLAGERGIATLGIGDGGNEIGMANIADTVKAHVPYGGKCQCPCGSGFALSTRVDALIAATISNWAGYALAALLGIATGVEAAICTAAQENRMLEAMANAGFHDAIYGGVYPSADGCEANVHQAMVTLLREAVLQGEKRY